MSSGSLKDTAKSLNQAFADPGRVSLPLPDEVLQTIEAFLDSHQRIDNHDSQRLQDELLKLHNKHVVHAPEKHGLFVNVLRRLRPAITGRQRLEEWWRLVLQPTIDAADQRKEAVEDAQDFLLGVLIFDEDQDSDGERAATSLHFTKRLLDAYLVHTRIPLGDDAVLSPEDAFAAHELEAVLIAFGRRRPKELLESIDQLFVQRAYRAQALGLLSSFVRLQPPHLHLVAQTELVEHLHQCLLLDTSSTVVDLAATILLMFIPHITSSLVSHLPTMLMIYSRLLCWDALDLSSTKGRDGADPGEDGSSVDEDADDAGAQHPWEVLSSAFDNVESANPRVDFLFTFIYGLFPINLMAFTRKPRKYLKAANYPEADDLDIKQDMIRVRTEPHRQVHLMHPNFYLMTQEEELNENRWIKADAADIVTECLNLYTNMSAFRDPGPPPNAKLPPIPKLQTRKRSSGPEALSATSDEAVSPTETRVNSSWRDTASTSVTSPFTTWSHEQMAAPQKSRGSSSHRQARSSRGTSPAARSRPDSPTWAPRQDPTHASISTAEIPLSPLDEQKRPLLATTGTLTSPRLDSFTQALSAAQFPLPPSKGMSNANKVVSLQRENMLLRNDLNFERYLKQQHLSHIGQLQRKHIREATVEAETQNLLNTNRTLRSKLAKASQQYEQLKKETTTSRSQSKKFEADLTSKVRSYREEERQWHTEEDKLRAECENLRKDCDNLRRLLVESEQREFNMGNQLRVYKSDIEELDSLRQEVQNLDQKLRDFEQRELQFEQAEEYRQQLEAEMEALRMRTASKDAERDRTRRNLEIRIKDLESKVETSRPASIAQSGPLPATVQQMLDSALAASQSRFNQLKKAHTRLLHQYTELEIKHSELEAYRNLDAGTSHPVQASTRGHDFDPPAAQSPNGPQRGVSDSFDTGDITNTSYSAGALPSGRVGRDVPSRLDSFSNRQQAQERAREKESQMDGNLSGFLSYNPTKPLDVQQMSSAKSTLSVDSKGSGEGRPKEKVKPQSEVRVYGRGGAQNIGSKSKSSKSGGDTKAKGLKGIRGIM